MRSRRVDEVPDALRPAWSAWSWGLGRSMARGVRAVQRRSSVVVRGDDPVAAGRACVVAAWHENIIPFLVAYADHPRLVRQSWLNHPLWFMRSVHELLFEVGIGELILGSTGHGGRRAADRLIDRLEHGRATVCWLDGPAGPRHEAKKGAAWLAARAQVPLVPLRIDVPEAWVWRQTWDHKRIPRPGGQLRVRYGAALDVAPTEEDVGLATDQIAAELAAE